jgi:hypothetical protein
MACLLVLLLSLMNVAAGAEVDVDAMRAQLVSACARGECLSHSNESKTLVHNTTDCHGRLTAYEYALTLIPARAPQVEVFDALELEGCGIVRPEDTPWPPVKLNVSSAGTTFYVDAAKGSDSSGSGKISTPFATIERAMGALRPAPPPRTLILRAGVHYLKETLALTPADSGLTISGMPDGTETAWISGGALLPALKWEKVPGDAHGAYVAQLPASAPPVDAGLQTLSPHKRVTRARFPNGDPELCTACWNTGVKLWHKDLSCVGKARVVYKNLVNCDVDHKLPDGSPCKDDSGMWDTYNTWSNGHGGCCSPWSGDASPYGPMGNYFCGNSSAGGWVGYGDGLWL